MDDAGEREKWLETGSWEGEGIAMVGMCLPPPNSYVGILMSKVMVLGGAALGRC